MGEFMHDDICEQILVRLDAKDLIRCKKVCKSWKFLISHPRFVKAHCRRQVNYLTPYGKAIIPNYFSKYGSEYYMIGSSNGLACITSFDGDEIIVANPWTREERITYKPKYPLGSCWGFGYDSLTDDYKRVYGEVQMIGKGKTYFYVWSLKSNVSKYVGHVNYTCFSTIQIGTLCNGALYWHLYSRNPLTEILISFDLSREVLKEIHQPDGAIRKCCFLAIKQKYVRIDDKYCENVLRSGTEKCIVKRHWDNTRHDHHTFGEYPYTFSPTTVMPSLISPHLQEGNE